MSMCSRVEENDEEKTDEMAIVDFISEYLTKELKSFNYAPEVVRQIMASITEAVIKKYETQKELNLS